MTEGTAATVLSVSRDDEHRFSKRVVQEITVLAGLGVEGDAHSGVTVQHRSRVRADPAQPNLRQVHLVHGELFEELLEQGLVVLPGQIGENIATSGLDLLSLPRGTVLRLGDDAVVELTGLRNPCQQLNDLRPGLLKALLGKDDQGRLLRKAGVMGVVLHSGRVRPGDVIRVELPDRPHERLEPV